ncbi:hsp90 co-chaperone Cdc37-like [Schistocerca americana]|uniref:hsp90 co-chaperone Cdc37-like n=1 Tax=Schistocerca americana TaxID=7009 RepID=UPI001F5031C4|nr:hsp90 co-chaperone Cdc37-like [Schistocerca americana]
MTYIAEGEDKKAFDNEPHSSIDEIHSRAAVKLKVALAEAEEEELGNLRSKHQDVSDSTSFYSDNILVVNVVAYSKWKDTEISDVEDDTHPYIDTSSFRWRHQARIARMEEQRRCKKETEKEHIVKYEKFVKNSEMLRRYNDSKRFLTRQPEHESEHTANYLVIWCIHLEMEEKHDLMDHVSHLSICIQYIQERHKKSVFFLHMYYLQRQTMFKILKSELKKILKQNKIKSGEVPDYKSKCGRNSLLIFYPFETVRVIEVTLPANGRNANDLHSLSTHWFSVNTHHFYLRSLRWRSTA